jgi:hypothetical protein
MASPALHEPHFDHLLGSQYKLDRQQSLVDPIPADNVDVAFGRQ